MAAIFPIELAADILSHLPAKSVARFSSVSKEWSSLFSDPHFAKLHCQHHRQNLKLIARDGLLYSLDLGSLDSALRVDYLLQDSDFTVKKVLGLSNGLVCLSVSSMSKPDPVVVQDEEEANVNIKIFRSPDINNDIIVICNLSTGSRHIVPPSPIEFLPYILRRPFSIEKRFSYGFGFSPSVDDYKLIRFTQYIYDDDRCVMLSEAKVYSMRTNSWCRVDYELFKLCIALKDPVLVDGVLYWFADWMGPNLFTGVRGYDQILAFDLAFGSFRRLPVLDGRKHCLGSLGGNLCVMCSMPQFKGIRFVKMEYHGDVVSWIPLFFFPYSSVEERGLWWGETFLYDKALTFSKNGDRVLVGRRGEDDFLCCDLDKETVSERQVHFFPLHS